MRKWLVFIMTALFVVSVNAQTSTVSLKPDESKNKISKFIYGQFAEHLGTLIYGGLWVGEDSSIPNVQGYRTDVINALKQLNIPVMRWPGGCFADDYHWMDGIGPKENRSKLVNNNWGGVVEDNSFGTNEFLNLCELLGCEPYISLNVGSGTVEEMSNWIEYMTSDADSPMANLRRKYGRQEPWKVRFVGLGNEAWGCGGQMRAEYYADVYRRYQNYARNYSGNRLFKVASGASDDDYNWTEVLMKNIGNQMRGLSVHYYSVINWNDKGSATEFGPKEYYDILGKCSAIEGILQKHMDIMDKYDPMKRIGLMVDEWGTWFNVEPGTNPGFLHQQSTMRDAFVAALSLNIFHKYTDRIQMANIAQVVNVLQAMILTEGDKMLLTPTYHVFEMYKPFQESMNIPLEVISDRITAFNRTLPLVSATAAKAENGKVYVSLSNISLDKAEQISVDLGSIKANKVSGRILTSDNITDHNTFDNPNKVAPKSFSGAKINGNKLTVDMPAKSLVVLELSI